MFLFIFLMPDIILNTFLQQRFTILLYIAGQSVAQRGEFNHTQSHVK